MTTAAAVAPPGELGVASQQTHDGEPHRRASSEALGIPGVYGEKKMVSGKAQRVYHAPRSFEQPTETFSRKTGMRDRGPPGYEYNNTDHLSISAVVKSGAPG